MGTRQPKVVGYLTEMVACKLKKKKNGKARRVRKDKNNLKLKKTSAGL